jgi:ApbE superfamily uncharacterized protein (UPF0280 family)
VESADLFRRTYECRETRGIIISDRQDAVEAAASHIKLLREKLEGYVQSHPSFLHSLHPINIDDGAKVVRLMAEAAERAGVGPMAAVAGVLADLAVEEMVRRGAKVAVVENGGEASLFSDRPMDIALSAGDTPLSNRMGFRLEHFPVGVATSSGLFSHALSFGDAEAVTVFAENAGLADATATAVGNTVKGKDEKAAVEHGVEKALSIDGVVGVFIVYRGTVGMGGMVPPIISVTRNEESCPLIRVESPR